MIHMEVWINITSHAPPPCDPRPHQIPYIMTDAEQHPHVVVPHAYVLWVTKVRPRGCVLV